MATLSELDDADGTRVLTVGGEFDIAVVEDFMAALRGCLRGAAAVGIDLTQVTFIDSSGLGALVRARGEAADAGTPLALVGTSAAVRRLLQVTGMQSLFDVRPARPTAGG